MADLGSTVDESAAIPNDHLDGLAHLLDAFKGNRGCPPEAYVYGDIALRLDFWVRTDDFYGHLKHKIAVFQRAPGVKLHPLPGQPDISNLKEVEAHKIGWPVHGSQDRNERPVLVFVGQFSETGQGVPSWAVESLVWLAEFDEPDGIGMNTFDAPLPRDALRMAAVLRRTLIEERKGVPVGRFIVGNDQLPGEMVEGGTKVLNVVANDDAPVKWRLATDLHSAEIARRLHVYIGDESIGLGFSIKEGDDLGMERLKMETCSLQLGNASF